MNNCHFQTKHIVEINIVTVFDLTEPSSTFQAPREGSYEASAKESKGIVVTFWDMENVKFENPSRHSELVMAIRNSVIYNNHSEYKFYVVRNVRYALRWKSKFYCRVRKDLEGMGVYTVDANRDKAEAADMTLISLIMRTAEMLRDRAHRTKFVIITSDGDFSDTIWHLKQTMGFAVVVVHAEKPAASLLKAAGEQHYSVQELLTGQPNRGGPVLADQSNRGGPVRPPSSQTPVRLTVTNLPSKFELSGQNKSRDWLEEQLEEMIKSSRGKIVKLRVGQRKGVAEVEFMSQWGARGFRDRCEKKGFKVLKHRIEVSSFEGPISSSDDDKSDENAAYESGIDEASTNSDGPGQSGNAMAGPMHSFDTTYDLSEVNQVLDVDG